MVAFMNLLARCKLVWGTLPAAMIMTATPADWPVTRNAAVPLHEVEADRPATFASLNDARPRREDARAARQYRTFLGYLEFDWEGDIPGVAPRVD